MTTIIGAVSGGRAYHASDRLVTVEKKDHDRQANKCIVVGAVDSVFCVGYTGVAYIGQIPTDRYIVEAITGRQEGMGAMRFGPTRVGTAWHVASKIRIALDRAFKDPRFQNIPHALIFSGLKAVKKGRRLEHLLWRMERNPGPDSSFKLEHGELRRRNFWGSQFTIGGTWDQKAKDELSSGLQVHSHEGKSAYRELLVDAIRSIAGRMPGVGPDCTFISIEWSETINIDAEYFPLHANSFLDNPSGQTHYVSYTPYFVTSGGVFAPSVTNGPGTMEFGNFKFNVSYPERPESRLRTQWLSSQQRMPPPGRVRRR